MDLATFLCVSLLWLITDVAVVIFTAFQGRFEATDVQRLFVLSFTHTYFDLWVVGLLRVCALAYWVVVVTQSARRSQATPNYVSNVVKVTMLMTWMFAGIKVLAFAENEEVLADRLTAAILGWTWVACMVNYVGVHIIQGRPIKRRYIRLPSASGSDSGERQKLLSSSPKPTPDSEINQDSAQEDWNRSQAALKKLARMSVPDLPFILGGLVFLLVTVASEILVPYFVGQTINSLVMVKSQAVFRTALVRLVLVIVTSIVCTWIRLWMFCMYTARLTARIRNTFFAVVMKQDLEFFCEYQTGDLVSRLMTATGQVGMGLSPNLDQFLRGLFTTIGVMLMMVETSWRMCMLPVILLPALVGVSRAYGIMSRSIGASSQQQMGDMSDLAEEKFSSMVTVRSFAMEDHEITRFARLVHGLYDNGKKEAFMHGTFQALALFVQATLLVCTIVYGGHLIEGGLLTGGDLVTVVLYLNQISSSIQIMNAVYSGIMKGVGCSQLVFEPLCRLKQGKSTSGSVIAENVRGEIEFRDVTFSFTNRPHVKVLNEVSFRVAPGEMVALVGPSGGGKSTCMALLQNFYQPRAGHVTLDGIPVQSFTHHCLHANVALVDQEPALFACSVRDNIRYGFSGGSDADVISAARQAHAHDFVCAFPDGYETSCGERGLQMSGGQKQRLAIARALIRRPKVLILDETTSALDCQTEAQVQATVNSLRGQCTVLWIAHHLNTVHIADRVLVLDKGRLVEQGTPSDLLARGGLFADLVRQQLGNVPGTGTNTMMSLPSRLIPTREDIDMKDKGGQSRVMVQKIKKRARVNKEEEEGSRAFDVNSGHYGSDVENGGVPLQKRAVVLSYRATAMQVADSML